MATATKKKNYTGADIDVLEGLEPVRLRPAMYIGGVDSRGLHHLLWEASTTQLTSSSRKSATRLL